MAAQYINVRSSRVRDLGLKQSALTQDEVVKIQNRVSKKECKKRKDRREFAARMLETSREMLVG